MNIWLISKYASPPQYTKAPSRLFFLAREFVQQGNQVNLFTSDSNHFSSFPATKDTYNYEQKDGVNIVWLKTKKYIKTTSLARILSWFDFERKLFSMPVKTLTKPDVVLVSSLSIFSILFGIYLRRKFKAFLIFEIRDIWPLTLTAEGGVSKWHPLVLLIGWVEKYGYKRADLIAGTMPKLDLHVRNVLGYDKPFFCAPLGFNPDDYATPVARGADNVFAEHAPKNKIIVGYAGSMGITNALENYIEAIKLLGDNPEIHFILVGSGDLREQFEQSLQHCANVTFLPRIPQNQVKEFLAICDIVYLSTQHSEVWTYGQSMNKVVEYMLAAKPIIATYSGFPSMINEANCGFFVNTDSAVDLRDAILKIAKLGKDERETMGERGRNWIYQERKYSHLADQYLKVIRDSIHEIKQSQNV
jgi:glycosyltransferase involved in cell wall biosynthesis